MGTFLQEAGIRGGLINGKKVFFDAFSFGEIYTLSYVNPISRGRIDFWDRSPLMIFTGWDLQRKLVEGMNFHFIFPKPARKRILERLCRVRQKDPKSIINLAWRERIHRIGISRSDEKRFNASIRYYDLKRINNVKMVPPNLWPQALVSVKPKFSGANEAQIQKVMIERSRT